MSVESIKELFEKRRDQGKDDSLARWYVAKLNKDIVGVHLVGMELGSKTVSIGQFGVTPQFRRQGIGRYLLFRALSDLQESNDRTIMLYTFKNNIRIIKLYESFGFAMETSMKEALQQQNENNLWLQEVNVAIKEIARLISSGESYIQVDDGTLEIRDTG